MGLWDKVKDAAQKAADAAKDQVGREDSILNKTVDASRKAAEKAAIVARDQVHRQDSALNKARASVAKGTDGVLGTIDAMDSNNRNDEIASAKRYSARRKAEVNSQFEEPSADAQPLAEETIRFPNSLELSDDEVYKQVSETIYPDFRTLPANDKKWALCEIARFDKKIVDEMRAIGSAYIDTIRNLLEAGDASGDGYRSVLDGSGLGSNGDVLQAYRAWLDDSYDPKFYEDDDGNHVKAVRMIGWHVFSGVTGVKDADAGAALSRSFSDAGVPDVYKLSRHLTKAHQLIDAREAVIERVFRPRRASFTSQFLVQRGLNADMRFAWIEDAPEGEDEPPNDSGDVGGGDSPFEI